MTEKEQELTDYSDRVMGKLFTALTNVVYKYCEEGMRIFSRDMQPKVIDGLISSMCRGVTVITHEMNPDLDNKELVDKTKFIIRHFLDRMEVSEE